MSDPRIAQLRAKADSTTFPAEAKALRAKADELEAKQPKQPSYSGQGMTVRDIQAEFARRDRLEALRRAEEERRRQAEATEASAKRTADWSQFPWGETYKASAPGGSWYGGPTYKRPAEDSPNLRTDWTGITFQKVTDINGNTYWTRVG